MKNNTPFNILDSYNKESYTLYKFAQSFFGYPNIIVSDDEYEDIEGKLYATAFAYLMQDFLEASVQMYPYEGWEELINIMEFKEDIDFFIKRSNSNIENDEFSELVWDVIQDYKKIIVTDIKNLFENKALSFFTSIFKLADDDYTPELSLEILGFMDEL